MLPGFHWHLYTSIMIGTDNLKMHFIAISLFLPPTYYLPPSPEIKMLACMEKDWEKKNVNSILSTS